MVNMALENREQIRAQQPVGVAEENDQQLEKQIDAQQETSVSGAEHHRTSPTESSVTEKKDKIDFAIDQGVLMNGKDVISDTLHDIEGNSRKFVDGESECHVNPPSEEPSPARLTNANGSHEEQINHVSNMLDALTLEDQDQRGQPSQPAEVVVENDHNLALQLQKDNRIAIQEASGSCAERLPTSLSPTQNSSSDMKDKVHHVKWINWHGTKTPIVTQNENGPCPLLAAMNVLLLRGQVNLPDGLEVVTSQNLMERLGDCILRLTPSEFAQRPDYQQNISDAVAVLPKLLTGLDVNVKFTGVSEFEYTPECIVFDLLNIPLYHGWLVEPENREATRVVNSLSYNQLVERIIEFKSSGDSSKVSEALMAEQFLENSASQLTYHGLYELNHRLKDGELAVFFRNNHFSTLVKHNTGLFLLVTDQGFLNEKAVIWETLNNIEGDSKFVDAEFHVIPPKQEPLPVLAVNASPQEQIDHDMMVAMALEDRDQRGAQPVEVVEECDRQLALQLQEEENRIAAQEASGSGAERTPAAVSPTESGGSSKKKDKCAVL